MSLPTSLLAYADCIGYMDKALADAKGVRVQFDTYEACVNFRMWAHNARRISRNDNAKIYPTEHMMHGRSAYDPLMITIKQDTEDKWWVYIERRVMNAAAVESLSEKE